ncbi:MAG: Gx transporter family protein [Spirochaetaceae bacterium]|jgi:uncharacterized membrane protein|nr:Gx transporter family protein [Spirochaetaceae bacterium]
MKPLSKKHHISQELLTLTTFLGALCLFFSTLEYLFPRPVPFFRLGLANLPILLSLKILPFPYLLLLALLKVLGQGLINGTLASYVVLFSFSGTFLSLFAMYSVRKIPGLSFIGISLIGAIFSNIAQVTLSISLVFGSNARFIIPYFFTMGLISGTAMGIFANWFTSHSKWYSALQNGYIFTPSTNNIAEQKVKKRKKSKDYISTFLPPQIRFFLGLSLLIPLFFQEVLILKIIHVITLGFLCRLAGKRLSYFYFINLIFWITLFQNLSPYGEVLLDLRFITITKGALESGLQKAFLLIGLVFTSLFSVSPGLQLPGRLGGVLARMFYFYEELYNGKRRIRRASFISDVDNLLGETQLAVLEDHPSNEKSNDLYKSKKSRALFFSISILIFYYTLLALRFLYHL